MNVHVELLFSCRRNDKIAVECLEHLAANGYPVRLLGEDEMAPAGSIAFYTHTDASFFWPSRNLRVAAHRLSGTKPGWAIATPFLVAIKPVSKGQRLRAVLETAQMYSRWYNGDTGASLPWETRNGRPSSYLGMVEEWFEEVAGVIGADTLQTVLSSQKLDKSKHTGRGGDIVYRVLAPTGKIVLPGDGNTHNLPRNQAYYDLTGLRVSPASYGTSDAANLFELLQLLKLAWSLGLPAVFETYPGSHDLSYWISGFLNPSLNILGGKVWQNDLTDERNAKYTTVITEEKMQRLIKSAKLDKVADVLMAWAGQPMWLIYQYAMAYCADKLMNSIGVDVEYRFTTTEEICQRTGLWEMRISELAKTITALAGHDVVVFNQRDGNQVRASNLGKYANWTVAQIHENGGWLGGAALYYMVYNLSNYGGVVVMVKDSTRGAVNLMARPFLENGNNLRITPVGLFRLTADAQNEDWSIDPLVMMQLLAIWGPEKTREVAQTIWNNMEVPLDPNHIGRKTVLKVTQQGVKVGISDS